MVPFFLKIKTLPSETQPRSAPRSPSIGTTAQVPGWYAFGLPCGYLRSWPAGCDGPVWIFSRASRLWSSLPAPCASVHQTATPEREAKKMNSASVGDPIAPFPRSAVSPLCGPRRGFSSHVGIRDFSAFPAQLLPTFLSAHAAPDCPALDRAISQGYDAGRGLSLPQPRPDWPADADDMEGPQGFHCTVLKLQFRAKVAGAARWVGWG
jgi:hypothetical protein